MRAQDYQGAITLLDLERKLYSSERPPLVPRETTISRSYGWPTLASTTAITSTRSANGIRKAIGVYDALIKSGNYDKSIHAWKACCQFGLCQYKEAKEECEQAPESDLKVQGSPTRSAD